MDQICRVTRSFSELKFWSHQASHNGKKIKKNPWAPAFFKAI